MKKISKKQQMECEKRMKVRMMAKAKVGAKRSEDSAMTSSVVIVPIFHERINNMKNF